MNLNNMVVILWSVNGYKHSANINEKYINIFIKCTYLQISNSKRGNILKDRVHTNLDIILFKNYNFNENMFLLKFLGGINKKSAQQLFHFTHNLLNTQRANVYKKKITFDLLQTPALATYDKRVHQYASLILTDWAYCTFKDLGNFRSILMCNLGL